MRPLWIAALYLVAVNVAASETVVVEQAAFCATSRHPVIVAMEPGHRAKGTRVDMYCRIDNGEKLVWTGSTDQQGVARPAELESGSYRVLAYSGKLSAEARLGVSNNSEGAVTCELRFVPPISAEQQQRDRLAALVKDAPSVQLKEFRGIVQDEAEAVIPHLKIRVLRKGAIEKGNVAETLSNEKGQFALPLDRGDYVAIFSCLGFRTRAIAIEIGKEGWRGVRIAMSVGGSSASPNAAPLEWSPAQ